MRIHVITSEVKSHAAKSPLALRFPPLEKLPAVPEGERWVGAAEGAALLGLTERAVRWRCETSWEANSLAVLCYPPGGGKAQWFIRSDADTRLRGAAVIVPAEAARVDVRDASRDHAGRRVEILERFNAGWKAVCKGPDRYITKEKFTRDFIYTMRAEGVDLSARTIRHWGLAVARGGVKALITKRESKALHDDPFLNRVRELYMVRGGISARYAYTLAKQNAAESGWEVCSLRKAQLFLAAIPEGERVMVREGPEAYKNKCESYIERDLGPVNANEQWESDHCRMDVWVKVGETVDKKTGVVTLKHERPWITSWFDRASRQIVAIHAYIGSPNTDAIILSFRWAVEAHGVPESVWVDCGKDYRSFALHGRTKRERRNAIDKDFVFGICASINVKPHNVTPFSPGSKMMERWHGTLHNQLDRSFSDVYCGRSPQHRPEGLQERLDAGKAPTLAEFKESLRAWVELYNATPHTGQGMGGKSPNEVYAEKLLVKVVPTAGQLAMLAVRHNVPVKVGRNGVRWKSLTYGKSCLELKALLGRKVVVGVNCDNAHEVLIFSMDGKLVCRASVNERLPANAKPELVAAAIKEQRHNRKLAKAFHQVRPRIHETALDTMHRLSAEQSAAVQKVIDRQPPPPMRPLRSPFDNQLAEITEAIALPLRKAAGAETMSLPSVDEQLEIAEQWNRRKRQEEL